MVGKVEAGIPEDDPRNAATIADNVGDNVGDCAGMAADLFETYAVTTVATMVLAAIFFRGLPASSNMMLLPLAICGVCIVTSIIGAFAVRLGKSNNIMGALYQGLIVTGVLSDRRGLVRDHKLVPADGIDVTNGKAVRRRPTLFGCGLVGLAVTAADRGDHRILHRHQLPAGEVDRQGLGLRPRHQRDPGPGHVAGVDRRCRRW
jgi:K(+)-stimulated pyrophosphate-energized sodium pump